MGQIGFAELAILQEGMTDQQKMLFMSQYSSEKKDRTIALILSIFLGELGIDRFYVGDVALGVIKLITLGGFLIWWFIDLFLIMSRVDEYNRLKASEIASGIKRQ